jgi:nicotinate-nucleotide--dimethylbenzimidazole phosphoribosyltransferase
MSALASRISRIRPPSAEAAEAARRCLDDKTKPVGSLGRLEELAIRLAAIHGRLDFATRPRAVVIFAADHGVTAQGVSAYPREVTAQMVRNFASGGAAINVLARQMEARPVIVDMGVAGEPEWPDVVVDRRLRPGTADMTLGAAMSVENAARAVEEGVRIAEELVADEGIRVLATGDMGIGNSTAAAALTAVFTGEAVSTVTGRGTGLDDERLARKIGVVARALECNRPSRDRPLEALAAVGGFEIGAIAGLVVGAAARRIPVVIDGFIAGAGALVAAALAPAAVEYMIASHRSSEPGHGAALQSLGLEPLLDLGLRLGEGTGAVLALPLLDAASAILREMASFESSGVSRKI